MAGPAGADQFVFTPGSQFATNTVVKFNAAKGDEVVLDNLVPVGVDPFAAGYLKIQTTTGLGGTTTNNSGAWTYTTGALSAGMQTKTAAATDAAGNVSATWHSATEWRWCAIIRMPFSTLGCWPKR